MSIATEIKVACLSWIMFHEKGKQIKGIYLSLVAHQAGTYYEMIWSSFHPPCASPLIFRLWMDAIPLTFHDKSVLYCIIIELFCEFEEVQ